MKKTVFFLSAVAFFLSALFTSCIPPNPSKASFLGEWTLNSVSGGISGDGRGYKRDFNQLNLWSVNNSRLSGKYSFNNNNAMVEFGTFVINFRQRDEIPTTLTTPFPSSGRIEFTKDPSSGSVGLNTQFEKRFAIFLDGKKMKLSSFAADGFEFNFSKFKD